MKPRPIYMFPLAALTVIVAIYVVFTIDAMLSDWSWSVQAVRAELLPVRATLLIFGCMIAGVWRVFYFHPRFAPKYAAWLSSTPWRLGKNPPLGPILFAWEDLLLVIPLGVLAVMDAGTPGWVPVTFYIFGYTALALTALRSDLNAWFVIIFLFLCSLPVLWHGQIIVLCVVLIAGVLLSQIAMRLSLREFPWDLADPMRESKRFRPIQLAWPLNRLGPAEPLKPIRSTVGFASAALIGWWTYVILKLWLVGFLGDVLGPLFVITDLPLFLLTAAFFRVAVYCTSYWPPISLRGRLMTGRFTVPGYDYVLISPLLMAVLGFFLPKILCLYVSLPITGAITTACVTAIGLNGGPTLRRWRLTGHYRLFPGLPRESLLPKSGTAR